MDRDTKDIGHIKSSDLQQALKDLNVFKKLHVQERITLARRYDDAENGNFAYHEMCDDLSRSFHQMHHIVPETAVDTALAKLRASNTSLRKVFRRVDKGDGQLHRDEYLDLLDFYQIEITEGEAREAFQEFARGRNSIDYNEFCDAVYPCSFSGVSSGPNSAAARPAAGNPSDLVREHFEGKRYELQKQFRKYDPEQSGQIGEDAFIAALEATNPDLLDDHKFVLALHYFPNAGDRIDYRQWIQKIW